MSAPTDPTPDPQAGSTVAATAVPAEEFTPDVDPAAPSTLQAEGRPEAKRYSLLWLALLALILSLLGAALLSLWQRLDQLQADASRRITTAEQFANIAKQNADTLSHDLRNAEARLAAAEARIADYTSQRAALDKLLADATTRESLRLSGDFEQLLLVAEQESQLTLNAAPMLNALKLLDNRADVAPLSIQGKLKAAIAKDIEVLRAADLPDRAQLLSKSEELAKLLEELPLAAEVKPAASAKASPKPAKTSAPKKPNTPDMSSEISAISTGHLTDTLPSIGELLSSLTAPLTDWLKLRRIDGPDALLVTPEQQFWLRENLKLQAQSARLSLLARQADSYQRNLEKLQQALQQYADPQQPKVQQALALITQLRAARIQAAMPGARETRAVLTQIAGSSLSNLSSATRAAPADSTKRK